MNYVFICCDIWGHTFQQLLCCGPEAKKFENSSKGCVESLAAQRQVQIKLFNVRSSSLFKQINLKINNNVLLKIHVL